MRILITGGAGFVGSSLARAYRSKYPQAQIIAFDNLKRRGSELNLATFKKEAISFHHGDIRILSDLEELPGNFDLFIEASAEPSVLAGLQGSPQYVLQTNLLGTQNCLEFARKRGGLFLFLSTSRVYSLNPLKSLKFKPNPSTRFELALEQEVHGVSSERGISEDFSTATARSFYGATKLASEILIQEYVDSYDLKAIINRCGVIAGPGQFGKVDQGVFTLWIAHHYFNQPLVYTGFGGQGYQVRDLLHPLDLFELIEKQVSQDTQRAEIYNLGGGISGSISLFEFSQMCQNITGNRIPIACQPESTSVDIPFYVSDSRKVSQKFNWKPKKSVQNIVQDIYEWIKNNEKTVSPIFVDERSH